MYARSKSVWLVVSILTCLIPGTASGRVEGTMIFSTPNGDVPGHFRIDYGHFVKARSLREPGLARLFTYTVVGTIEVDGEKKIVCHFEVDGQKFDGLSLSSGYMNKLEFETACLEPPGYVAAVEIADSFEETTYYYRTESRWRSDASGSRLLKLTGWKFKQRTIEVRLRNRRDDVEPTFSGTASFYHR